MSPPSQISDNGAHSSARDSNPPTVAAFSPTTIAGSSLTSRQRSSVIVHRKSPLLVATPPPVTRALAHSHPFLLPLNKLAGLLTWSSGDPWASFLLVAGFWAIVLYSDAIILYAGPIIVVAGLILGMYSRRYSPLSSTGLTGEKHGHRKQPSEIIPTRHQKSLDEIVETMREFTTRCNTILGPLREMTDFLSTQSSATSATTRPALTSLLIRIICVTPIWILLTLPPFYIITTRRVVLSVGTVILTYHSSPARVFRVLLWRSLTIRRICAFLTGLNFSTDKTTDKLVSSTSQSKNHATAIATSSNAEAGVRFTFIVYENQRRWLGIGWTYSLFPHERTAWTDEHLNPVPAKDSFELPDAKGGNAAWRWVEGSQWRIEGGDGTSDGGGWIYYDNKVSPVTGGIYDDDLTVLVARWSARRQLGPVHPSSAMVQRCRTSRNQWRGCP
jgi:Integral peroxisomal membrane peroxin